MHLEITLNSCWLCVPGFNSSVISNIQSSHSHACMYAKSLQSCPTLCDPVDSSPQGSTPHGDSPRQGYWSGLPCPPPGDLPNPGIKSGSLMSTTLAGGFFVTSATNGKPPPSTIPAIPISTTYSPLKSPLRDEETVQNDKDICTRITLERTIGNPLPLKYIIHPHHMVDNMRL